MNGLTIFLEVINNIYPCTKVQLGVFIGKKSVVSKRHKAFMVDLKRCIIGNSRSSIGGTNNEMVSAGSGGALVLAAKIGKSVASFSLSRKYP